MALQEQIGSLRDAGPRAVTFLSEVWIELKKVHWPTRSETQAATAVVLVVSGIAAIYLGLIDLGLSYLVSTVLG